MLIFSLTGPKRNHIKAQEFIHDMFKKGIPQEMESQFFLHFTCCTDTDNIRKIFEDVRKSIIQGNLGDIKMSNY